MWRGLYEYRLNTFEKKAIGFRYTRSYTRSQAITKKNKCITHPIHLIYPRVIGFYVSEIKNSIKKGHGFCKTLDPSSCRQNSIPKIDLRLSFESSHLINLNVVC